MIRFTNKVADAAKPTSGEQASTARLAKGVIEKIDAKAGKITISHEELENLQIPAAQTQFRTAKSVKAEKLAEGQGVLFAAEKTRGKLTITEIE